MLPPDESTAPTDARIGQVLSDRYRLDSLLGEGAMGRVYLAEHVMMRKRVAVKILHAELTRVPEVVGRFEREAMAAANIDHANVAAATDFGKLDDGSIYLVLEFVEGRNLREEVLKGPMPLGRALHVVRQMAGALGAAHAQGIVHRDLKPENVMLVQKAHDPDFVKVLDFGIAKVPVDAGASPGSQTGVAITRVGMVFGTPEYMAPEQALGKQVDSRADLYALGVILFELLSGLRPFDDKCELGVLGQQLSKSVPRIAERAPGVQVPESVEALVRQLLKREISERPSQVLDVARAIDSLLAQFAPEQMMSVPGSIPGTGSYPGLGSIPGVGSQASLGSIPDAGSIPDESATSSDLALPALDFGVSPTPPHSDGQPSAPHTLASGAAQLSQPDLAGSTPSLPDLDLDFPAAAPGRAGGGGSDLLESYRAALPPQLREMPTAVLVGAPIGLLVLAALVVLLLVGAVATHAPGPTASAADTPSSEPEIVPRTQAGPDEIADARRQGVEALEGLSKLYPEDTAVMLELSRAYVLKQRRSDAVSLIGKALALKPEIAKDPGAASTLWVAAQDDSSQDQAFALLQGPMKAKGADIIYDLVVTAGVRHKVVSRAEKWLASDEFQQNSSPALNIAVALRNAKSCGQRSGLLMRAKNAGDKRSLTYLHRFAQPTGCGRGGRGDCNPCLRKDDQLKRAIEAIEKR